jgi:hypothetical protein
MKKNRDFAGFLMESLLKSRDYYFECLYENELDLKIEVKNDEISTQYFGIVANLLLDLRHPNF